MRPTGISLYVHGAPGISKSAVIRQVADELGIAFIDLRLSQMAPEDVRGVPMLADVDGVKGVLWTPPLVFPRDLDFQQTVTVAGHATIRFHNPKGNNGIHYCTAPEISVVTASEPWVTATVVDQRLDRCIVVVRDNDGNPANTTVICSVTGRSEAILGLEELNSAPQAVMAAAYQLVLDRRLGDYVVPDGVMLIATGNREGDKGVTHKLPKPLANRFDHLEMVVNSDDWLTWAMRNHLHPDVVGYIARWPGNLFIFDPNSPRHAFPTPRTWEMVARIISQESDPEVMRALVCGAIGDAVGGEFLIHRSFMEQMPDVHGILDGSVTQFKPDRSHATQIAYSTAVQLLYVLKELHDAIRLIYPNRTQDDRSAERKQWNVYADRAIGFMLDHFVPEVTVAAIRMGMSNHGLRFSSEMPRYRDFTNAHKDIFFG